MKVLYVQKGGLAGLTLSSNADTDLLSPDEKQKIEEMIAKAKFFDLPSKSPPPNPGAADYYLYKITVETEKRNHTVETTDLTMPPELRPLITYFRKKAVNGMQDGS
jgi:hypothetical protein